MLGLYFLGTSSGVPTKERNVSGIAVTLPQTKSWILVDCGEGTQHQILSSPHSLLSLKAICITHVHGDHWKSSKCLTLLRVRQIYICLMK